MMSIDEPALNGMMQRIGWLGHCWADAKRGKADAPSADAVS